MGKGLERRHGRGSHIRMCMFFFCLARVDVTLFPGRLILYRSHRIRYPKDSESEGEPRGPVGLL